MAEGAERDKPVTFATLFGGPLCPGAVPSKARTRSTLFFHTWQNLQELCVLPMIQDNKQNGNFYRLYAFVASLIQSVLGNPAPPPESTEQSHCFRHRTK